MQKQSEKYSTPSFVRTQKIIYNRYVFEVIYF